MTNKAKSGRPTIRWTVGHPDMEHRAFVLAENWELATVAAAEYWGVPWAKVAAGCFEIDRQRAIRNCCIRCGGMYFGEGPMCVKCTEAKKTEDTLRKRAMSGYYRRAHREWKERAHD